MRKPRPGDVIAQSMFGRDPQECYAQGICVVCGEDVTVFADTSSRREYEISVMCQKCQDDTFGLDSE